jgi:hypothetical protein
MVGDGDFLTEAIESNQRFEFAVVVAHEEAESLLVLLLEFQDI